MVYLLFVTSHDVWMQKKEHNSLQLLLIRKKVRIVDIMAGNVVRNFDSDVFLKVLIIISSKILEISSELISTTSELISTRSELISTRSEENRTILE